MTKFQKGDIVHRTYDHYNGEYLARVTATDTSHLTKVEVLYVLKPADHERHKVGKRLMPYGGALTLVAPASQGCLFLRLNASGEGGYIGRTTDATVERGGCLYNCEAIFSLNSNSPMGGEVAPRRTSLRWLGEPWQPAAAPAAKAEWDEVEYLRKALKQTEADYSRRVQEANNRVAKQIMAAIKAERRAVEAEKRAEEAEDLVAALTAANGKVHAENMRLRAAVASAQTHLGNLVRDYS